MKKGIIIGRFQTSYLHDGHIKLIDEVFKKHGNDTVIFLGTSLVHSRTNPLSYKIRKFMIQEEYPLIDVRCLMDVQDDDLWVSELDEMIKKLYGDAILYGGRDSFIKVYKKNAGQFETVTVEHEKSKLSSTEIRDRVASEIINNESFRRGVIYAQYNNKYPTAYSTVDLIIWRQNDYNKIEILLGKKKKELKKEQWRFPGGFVDVTDERGCEAASREAMEETGIIIDPDYCKILGQLKIRDWRYKNTEDGIMTSVYVAQVLETQQAIAGDDLAEVKWFDIKELKTSLFRK